MMTFRFLAYLLAVAPALFGVTVTINTSALGASSSGPFTLDFQFVDGNGTGDGNNLVTLSNFSFGGGSINMTPVSNTGGVQVGSSPFTLALSDTAFFTDVQFSFTPGSVLSFDVTSTAHADSTTPDAFTFAILDSNSNEIPTANPNGLNSFVELDLPTQTSGTSFIVAGSAIGGAVTVPQPLSPCDVSKDGNTNVVDAQYIITEALSLIAATDDLNGNGAVNLGDVQIVINAALGLACAAQ
jgi:hypothetical protein